MGHNQPLRLERIFQAYDPPLYFVTLCTAERRKILNKNEVHDAFVNYCRRSFNHDIPPSLAAEDKQIPLHLSVPFGSADFLTTSSAIRKVMCRSGITFEKIPSELAW